MWRWALSGMELDEGEKGDLFLLRDQNWQGEDVLFWVWLSFV